MAALNEHFAAVPGLPEISLTFRSPSLWNWTLRKWTRIGYHNYCCGILW